MKSIVLLALTACAASPQAPNRKPGSAEQSAALAAIREYASSYSQRLPDYICTQLSRRTTSLSTGNRNVQDVQHQDVFELQTGVANHRELQKLVSVNGKPSSAADAKAVSGVFSRGEFTTLLARIFDPQTGTQFKWERWATRDGRRMRVFSYMVPQAKGYTLQEDQRTTVVPFKGLLYADAENNAVTRIEMETVNIPARSEYESVSLKLNYKVTPVSGVEAILPADFEMRVRRHGETDQVDAKFTNYRRFTADAAIDFGTGAATGR